MVVIIERVAVEREIGSGQGAFDISFDVVLTPVNF